MSNTIYTERFIQTNEFVEKPVNEFCNKIKNNSSKKIILSGGRGTGKSLILYNNQNININSKDQCIFTRFDSVGQFSSTSNELFLSHYYELIFCLKILNYIKKYYYLIYEFNFKRYETILNRIAEDTDKYIRNFSYYDYPTLNKCLKTGDLSCEMLKLFRKYLNIKSLSLAIDRFDWTNSNSELSQNILIKYSDMFDKTIITTDDDLLLDIKNRNRFIEKGYSFIDVDYGKNKEVVKEIIKRRIEKENQCIKEGYKSLPIDIIDVDEIYEKLIKETNGNISLMLEVLRDFINIWQWESGNININKELDLAIKKENETAKTLKKMRKPIKLHL